MVSPVRFRAGATNNANQRGLKMAVSFVGAADNNSAPVVNAADAMVGILSLLAWAGAGVNMFPDSVDVSGFWKGEGSL
jgi:hypothetical protein